MVSETYYVDVCDGGEDKYRFGFNGMEKDNEVKGIGNSLDFGARMYDARLGRWMSLDPLAKKYPSLSPYNFVANSPIVLIDPDGEDIIATNKKAQQLIIFSVSPEESKFVAFNEKGHINVGLLESGLEKLESVGENYQTLLSIAKSKEIVEVTVANNPTVKDGNGKLINIKMAYIEDYPMFDDDYNEIGTEKIIQGTVGISLPPSRWDAFTDFDKNILNRIPAEYRRLSTNDNFQVIVSETVYDEDNRTATGNMGHELYGHIYYLLSNKKVKGGLHGPVRNADNVNANETNFNQDVEKQIRDRTNEAEKNYDKHNQ